MIGYKFLKSHCLFGGLSEEEVGMLRPFLQERHYAVDDEIVKEGDRGDRLYFICEGSVAVIKGVETERGRAAQRIATLGVGDTFGEMELLDVAATEDSLGEPSCQHASRTA